MFVIGQSQHVAGPAIITIVLQAACCETDSESQPARCHLAPNKVSLAAMGFWGDWSEKFQGDFSLPQAHSGCLSSVSDVGLLCF